MGDAAHDVLCPVVADAARRHLWLEMGILLRSVCVGGARRLRVATFVRLDCMRHGSGGDATRAYARRLKECARHSVAVAPL